MAAARLTPAEARRLGIDVAAGQVGSLSPAATTASRTTRRTAPGPYRTRCVLCGVEFTTMASEDRHVTLTHSRFELVL